MIEGQEIFVILLVALVVLGPQRLPELARRLGKWTADLRRAARDFQQGLEAEVGDLRQMSNEIKAPLKEIQQPFKEVDAVMRDAQREVADTTKNVSWIGPVPEQGPGPADAAADLAEIEATGKALADEPEADVDAQPSHQVTTPADTGQSGKTVSWIGPEPGGDDSGASATPTGSGDAVADRSDEETG